VTKSVLLKYVVNRVLKKIFSLIILFSLFLPARMVEAQATNANGPVYIVQEGDSLWEIAYRFHVSQTALENANGIINPDQIAVGKPLIIPGLEGIQGELTTVNVLYGETLNSLSLRYNLTVDMLERLNHVTSPNELYAGYSLVIEKNNTPLRAGKRTSLEAGQSLLELAVLNDSDPWTVLADNKLDNSSLVVPGDVILVPGEDNSEPGGLPPEISSVNISGLIQGETAEIQASGSGGLSISGSLMDHPLNFFAEPDGGYVTLQGVHAMVEPGLYPLDLIINLSSGHLFDYSQYVYVSSGDFLYDVPLSVDPATLDPETTVPEDKQWISLASQVSPDKLWQGIFTLPVEPVFGECYASKFGSRRSYNGSEYIYFHTGLDYCGQIGDPIYATATGVVVFAGPLTVRGNATMLDHGHGVFSAYMHQSEILVNVGDRVEQGQLIGRVGNTGRVEGPHLHFEILVGGVQVDPLEWLNQTFP
jgi:murein DD-endopeptidase MepM/ murein hydrolase activator NlpD